MKSIIITCALLIVCFTYSFGQYNVLLVKGKAVTASAVEVGDESVMLKTATGEQTINKADVLCVIPDSGKSFTFRMKNDKKMKILKKDMENEYKGADIARLFAYKYYKSQTDIGQLYALNSDHNLTEEEFRSAFEKQQKKFKKRTIVSASLAGFVFIIGTASFISTMNEASNYL